MTLNAEERSKREQRRSPSVEQRVAGTISCDVAAKCRCRRVVTSDTRWKLLDRCVIGPLIEERSKQIFCPFLGAETHLLNGSHGCLNPSSPNLATTSCTITVLQVSFRVLHFQTWLARTSDVENDTKFWALLDPLWKLQSVGQDLCINYWSFTYDWTARIHLITLHGCWAQCIDEQTESWAAFIKAFWHTCWHSVQFVTSHMS